MAQTFGWKRGRRPLAAGELDLLLAFAGDPDEGVRHAAAIALQRLGEDDKAAAYRLVGAIDFSDSPRLAEAVFTAFSAPFGLRWGQLPINQRSAVRAQLLATPQLDVHFVTGFLADLSAHDPAWVLSLLRDRVERAETMESLGDYRPVPYHWNNKLRVREHSSFPAHLQSLHAWIAEAPTSWIRQRMGAEIFDEVALRYDQAVLPVLRQALKSDEVKDISAVAAIIRQAHRTFIWDEPDFVVEALQASHRFGNECHEHMVGALWGATISGGRTGIPGKPFKEDIEQRDRSLAIAAKLPTGSMGAQFYQDISKSAESSIARAVDEDRVDDGRDW